MSDEWMNSCGGCHKLFPPGKLQKCAACKNISYCCKACQTEDWKRRHKHDCQLSTDAPKKAKSAGQTRTHRLFSNWNEECIKEAGSYYRDFFPFDKLNHLAETNEIIVVVIKFDYNYQTFVLDRPPEIHSSSSPWISPELRRGLHNMYSNPCPEGMSRVVSFLVEPHGHQSLSAQLMEKPAKSHPCLSLNELNFRCRKIELSSRLFATWDPLRKSNVKLQLEALESQVGLKSFVENVLRLHSKHPRHMTHMVVIHCKFGFGLGEIKELASFEVRQIHEVVDMVMHSNMTEEDKQKCKISQLDVESSPLLVKRRQEHPHAVLVPVALVSPNLAPTIHTMFSDLPPDRPLRSAVSSQKKVKRQFEQLQKFTFPQVESPELH